MNFQPKPWWATLACLSITTPVAAQQKLEDELVVTATRVEQPLRDTLPTAHVISALEIERMQPRDLPSLLGRVSGLDFRDSGGRGSTSGIFIRGATPGQTIVLVDGVRTASATTGATALENIPTEAIERIEVVKGPLSGLYGADAVGGVIQIFTKKAATEGMQGSVTANYGSHNSQDYTTTFSAGNAKHQLFASFSYEESDGIDRTDLTTGGNNDHDSFDEKSGNISASVTLTDKLNAQFNYLKSESTSEFDNVFGVDNGRYSESELETLNAKFNYRLSDTAKVSVDLGYLTDHLITPAFTTDIETNRSSIAVQGDFQVSPDHLLSVGADYYNDEVDTLTAFPETERDNRGVFAQWQGKLNRLSIVGNLRYDDNEAYGSETNGSLALGFKLTDNLELVASYGTAFKAPSFNDLYFPFFGNPSILPEESDSAELSLKGWHDNLQWRVSAYRTNVDNLIGFDLATFTANNTSEATLQGVEMELSTIIYDWLLSANLNYLDARNEDTNEYLDDRATVAANIELGRSFNRLYLGVDLQTESGRHDQNGVRLSGFTLFGLKASYQVNDRFKIAGRIDNLFDKDYTRNLATSWVAYETEGRFANLSLTYTFK